PRPLHPADLVHRPAGGRGPGAAIAGVARRPTGRRTGHRSALARGRGPAHRLRVGAKRRRRGAAAGLSGRTIVDIDLPDVVAEVTAAFTRYEAPLVAHVVDTIVVLVSYDQR